MSLSTSLKGYLSLRRSLGFKMKDAGTGFAKVCGVSGTTGCSVHYGQIGGAVGGGASNGQTRIPRSKALDDTRIRQISERP